MNTQYLNLILDPAPDGQNRFKFTFSDQDYIVDCKFF
jgi:hypothetical protein